MINRKILINTFQHLSEVLSSYPDNDTFKTAESENPWFTPEFSSFAFKAIAQAITKDKVVDFYHKNDYPFPKNPKSVGLAMAGNIPLAGFFDLMMILLSGNKAIIHKSHADTIFPHLIVNELFKITPALKSFIFFSESLKDVNALIASGSDNSAMYFSYYFKHIPHIIRKNRNAVAIINDIKKIDFHSKQGLADDMLLYFGLGCRNVSKLYTTDKINENQFTGFIFDLVEPYRYLSKHINYANNYLYQKTLFTMNEIKFYDNGFILLVPAHKIHSPVSVYHFQFLSNEEATCEEIEKNRDSIQCIATEKGYLAGSIPFGKTQQPELWDFADGINVMEFLAKI